MLIERQSHNTEEKQYSGTEVSYPRQFRVPREKAIKYLSSLGFSIHLSGRKSLGLSKKSE